MNLKKWIYGLLPAIALTIVQTAYAKDVTIIGSVNHTLKATEQESFYNDKKNSDTTIKLMLVKLSEEARTILANRAQDALAHTNYFSPTQPKDPSLPATVELGMNSVPVLNQGAHGTCVTFTVTGAVDAIIGKGDYLSQLCQLQLSGYLQQQGTGKTAWNGAYFSDVIHQMEQYGVVNKKKQRSEGCGDYYHYPVYTSHPDSSVMELTKFQELSESVFGNIATWSQIPVSLTYNSDPAKTLENVKQALNEGDRVIFATLLPRNDLGSAGAMARHNTWWAKDTWILTPEILEAASTATSAHALIITGYDDDAVALDADGGKHKGLLSLRNSWGWLYGYWGEYYMSYDYFKLLSYDAQRISAVKS